jgi:FixJ family two-component response regulator
METTGPTTFVVDDDASVLKALGRLLRSAGYEARTFSSAKDFLAAHDPDVPGCAVLDLTMPGVDGLELQRRLTSDGVTRPIIFLTGNGNIASTVRAMKAGAVDFLTKPVKREQLLSAINHALEQDAMSRREHDAQQAINDKLAKLTPREREVLSHVVTGRLNKQIAADLGTVEKTIKVHRGRVMVKLGVRSVAELVRLTERVGLERQRSHQT